MDEKVKESFQKVKEDMLFLNQEVDVLKLNLIEIKDAFTSLSNIFLKSNERNEDLFRHYTSYLEWLKLTQNSSLGTTPSQQTDQQTGLGEKSALSTHIPTPTTLFKPLKDENPSLSIGNEGVQTDRQIDRQTDKFSKNSPENYPNNPPISTEKPLNSIKDPFFRSEDSNSIENAAKMLDSLDVLKKEIRIKFKRLTDQEFIVFSTIYQLDEEFGSTDYKTLSEKLNLTESSIRDYVGRLIKKGIPLEKSKINNKSIALKVSENLKKVATLKTILQLKGI